MLSKRSILERIGSSWVVAIFFCHFPGKQTEIILLQEWMNILNSLPLMQFACQWFKLCAFDKGGEWIYIKECNHGATCPTVTERCWLQLLPRVTMMCTVCIPQTRCRGKCNAWTGGISRMTRATHCTWFYWMWYEEEEDRDYKIRIE